MKRIGHGLRRLLRRDQQASYDLQDIQESEDTNTNCPAKNTKFMLKENNDIKLPFSGTTPKQVGGGTSASKIVCKNEETTNINADKDEGQDSWVVVHKLKSQSDGGILDLDDKLIDVADDREQIMAIFEEDTDGMPSLHNAGDGTSASSVGTNSPDIFQGTEHKFQPFARTDIEITGEELNNGSQMNGGGVTLQVRRGSEPALNRLSPVHLFPPDPSKRWSAAPVIDEDKTGPQIHNFPESSKTNNNHVSNSVISNTSSDNRESSVTSSSTVLHFNNNDNTTNSVSVHEPNLNGASEPPTEHYTKFLRNKSSGTVNSQINGNSRFSRDYNRLSMQFFGDGSSKWSDAADRALCLSLRKEPVGANASPTSDDTNDSYRSSRSRSEERSPPKEFSPQPKEVILRYEVGPLGIHLVPEHNEKGKNQGLIVQNVEIGGRIDRNGCLKAQDKIIEINGHCLIGMPFQNAQELFRQGLNCEELKLKVIQNPIYQHQISTLEIVPDVGTEDKENMVHSEEKIVGECKLATVSSTRKSPLQQLPLLRPGAIAIPLIASNTRKIGRKYEVDLQKGPQGLGFSITTRDNPAGGNCPIYIKNILPHGAAIDDGRLRPGDRLLEVNGIEITGKTQSEAVSILKNIPLGGIVKLIVSRQERIDLSPKLPRQIPPEKITEDLQPVPWTEKEILVYDIPVLDTEKAGLGISVKGKTATPAQNGMIDMGIFIKSVIHGGAASRDGRVKSNDQLLSVNGVSLQNCSNTQAMETLRKTMTQDGPKPKPGFITLRIARRVPTSSAPNTDLSGCGSSASGDEMDSWGSKNISLSVDGSRSRNEDLHSISPQNNEFNSQQSRTNPNPHNFNSGSPNMRQANDDIIMHSPATTMQNMINRSRSSSLRKIDVLKGKFEGNTSTSPMQQVQRVPLDLPRNPVLERLTGKNVMTARSDSYYKATNELSFSPTSSPPTHNVHNGRVESQNYSPRRNSGLLVQNVNGETIMLEDDYSAPQKPPRRSRSSTPEDSLDSRIRRPPPLQISSPISPNNMIISQVQAPAPSDVTYASQTSLEDAGGFSRDAFGRQSISEKRHATLDAKSTDTYQRNKKLRDEREKQKQHGPDTDNKQRLAEERNLQVQRHEGGLVRVNSADSLVDSLKMSAPVYPGAHRDRKSKSKNKDIGPSLGMKKSSSLESLQTMVQEIVIEDDMRSGYAPQRSGPQAVKVIRGRGCNESFRQAVDRSYEAPFNGLESQMETLAEEETESCLSGPPSGRNQRADMGEADIEEKNRAAKKKPGLFRGLGSMFRFGRHRKPNSRNQNGDYENSEKGGHYGSNIDPIQEQYRRLAEKRDARSIAYGTTSNSNDYADDRNMQPSRMSSQAYSAGSGSMRVKKPNRKSMEMPEKDINGNPSSHARSQSYDVYNEIMTRPGSRVGFADPKKYSHYINYDEIKQHLNRRHQQHYHSQRRENPRERHDRPVSNFYEYESVKAAMHSQQQQPNQNQVIHQGQGYGMSTVAMQQQNQRNNNNGVTLPSPTVPMTMGSIRQISSSQFQAVPSTFHQNQSSRSMLINEADRGRNLAPTSETFIDSQSQPQRRSQQQNSLPRRHPKEVNYNQTTPSNVISQHRHTLQPHQFPNSGRYAIGPPPQNFNPHSPPPQQMQSQYHQQNLQGTQSQSNMRVPHQTHQHSNGGGMYTSPMSVGSKV